MIKDKLRPAAPYIGLPIIGLILLFAQIGRMEAFDLLQYELLSAFGYIAAISDLKAKRIPNILVLAMLAGWLITLVPQLFLHTQAALGILQDAALGFALGGGTFLLVYIISRKGLGGGDVKFMAAAGLYLGLYGVIPAMLYGTVLAGLTALPLVLFKRIGRKDALPLAPFLYIGILLVLASPASV
jgi:Flp pilus assembly protein protease CpaA